MPLASIRLKPGLDTEATPTYDSATYDIVEFGRFKSGLFQKLGGWEKFYPLAVSGEGKALHAWQDLNSIDHLAVATTTGLFVITNGVLIEVSPQVHLSNTLPNFSTTIGDATVTIIDTGILNITPTDSVEFLTPISVGGIILSGIYPIATQVSGTSYTIEARELATATEMNGGAVPEFDTTSGSSTINVTLADHAQSVGNTVVFPIPTVLGGLTIVGKYTVNGIVGADEFTVSATEAATSTANGDMNGGDAGFRYLIALGPAGAGLGYGLGDYGEGPYGLGGGAGADQTGTPLAANDWSLDNWGELLIANPENGGIYFWGPSSGFQNLQIVDEAPLYNTGMFVSAAQQQIIAYGSSINAYEDANGGIGVYQDPLLIQWCDLSNFFEWEARADTQAGNFRIPTGSRIVGAGATKNRGLFWTDLDLYAGIYIGQPFIYSHNKIGSNCGLIGKHAWGQFGDATYWMGKSNFFTYAGAGVQPVLCPVWDAVFQDINPLYAHKSVCGSNTDFTEVWFFYCSISGGRTAPDKCAKFNIVENTWELVPISRLAWIDRSVLGSPTAIDENGIIYSHETSPDADGQPLTPHFRTSYFYVEDSQDFVTIDRMIPDFRWGLYNQAEDAQISITLYSVETPGEVPAANGPYLVTRATKYVTLDPPLRAKQIALDVSSADTGSFWRLGLCRFRYAAAGRSGG